MTSGYFNAFANVIDLFHNPKVVRICEVFLNRGVKDGSMRRLENVLKMPEEQFKRIIGTTKPVFETMLEILQAA